MDDSNAQATTQKTSRLVFIDHLRVFLIILVVLHHVAAVYGAGTEFYYVEPPFTDPTAFNLLLAFMLMNQAWFMGAFFLIAGYFTPGSFDRKGPFSYLKDRLLRLGVPLALFFFILNPLSSAGYFFMPAELTGITTPLSFEALFPDFIGLGPLWFVAMLLIFCIGYALWRWLTKSRGKSTSHQSSFPGYIGIGVFVLVLAGISFLMRMVVPIGEHVRGFPTLAYFPQYLSLFVLGVFAYRRNWFQEIPNAVGMIGFLAAALVGMVLFPYLFSGHWFALEVSESLGLIMGDGSWHSALYALFDSVFAVGMCLGLVTFFRKFQNKQSQLGRFLSHHSYAVYVFHIPIIVYLAYALRGLELASLLKFAVVSLIVIPVCYVVAMVVRKIPGVSKVM
jgi:peptidoglycan/LPS O-acetylase OafA/YrhL